VKQHLCETGHFFFKVPEVSEVSIGNTDKGIPNAGNV